MSPLETVPDYDFCTVYSRLEAEEPLRATSTRADIWMLLEYTGAWGRRAFPESDLSDAVKSHVDTFRESTANTRIQFIRKPGVNDPQPIHFYVAVSHHQPPRLYAFLLDRYEDLLDLDLEAIVAHEDSYAAQLSDEKLFLVCVNGRRDACCAKFGIPVQAAIAEVAGDAAWQSTHIGGHRLGPNLLFLPHGISYGRGRPELAEDLVHSYQRDELYLPHLRGRTIYDRPLQAALHFLREKSGELAIDAFRPLSAENVDDGHWHIILEGQADRVRHHLYVEARRLDHLVFKTCYADEPAPVEHYYLLGYKRKAVSS